LIQVKLSAFPLSYQPAVSEAAARYTVVARARSFFDRFVRRHCRRIEEFDAVSEQPEEPNQDQAEASILDFDVDDAAIEIAAAGVGTVPTASVNIIPPNCCVQQPR
jgi:hypothetical protein